MATENIYLHKNKMQGTFRAVTAISASIRRMKRLQGMKANGGREGGCENQWGELGV